VITIIIFVLFREIFKNINPAKTLKRVLALISIGIIFLFLSFEFFYSHHRFSDQLSVDYVIDYYMQDAKNLRDYQKGAHAVMGRGRAVVEAINLISNNIYNFLIGMGSGSSSEASFIGTKGKYYFEYGPMAGIGRVQFSKLIVELGFIGTFLVLFFFVKVFIRSKQKIQNKGLTNNIFIDLLFILFLNATYSPILNTEITMLIVGFLIVIMNKDQYGKSIYSNTYS
jgi:O-antigen ligase